MRSSSQTVLHEKWTGEGPREESSVASRQADALAQLVGFRKRDAQLAEALGLTTCLKPEVALMIELYEAGIKGNAVTVSVLGMQGGIAPTTTLRYLEALQKKGAVRRVAHETDNRMTYVELTESAKAELDAAFGG